MLSLPCIEVQQIAVTTKMIDKISNFIIFVLVFYLIITKDFLFHVQISLFTPTLIVSICFQGFACVFKYKFDLPGEIFLFLRFLLCLLFCSPFLHKNFLRSLTLIACILLLLYTSQNNTKIYIFFRLLRPDFLLLYFIHTISFFFLFRFRILVSKMNKNVCQIN